MLAGLPYKAWLDGLSEERMENKKRIYRYNSLSPASQDKLMTFLEYLVAEESKKNVSESDT